MAAQPRIFVSIAAYRDPECQPTVIDLLEQAAHPRRVHVRILWQYERETDRDYVPWRASRSDQVRLIKVGAQDSKGTCWARSELHQHWQGEEYMFQIDSHMRFEPGWDELLVGMHNACLTPKAVLTTYPFGYRPPRVIPHRGTTRLVPKSFDRLGVMTLVARSMPRVPSAHAPSPGAFVSAGMLFGPGVVFQEVPYDPHLYFIGEEITLSARLWTHGYDIYHPAGPIAYHCYSRLGRRTHWDDHRDWAVLNERSCARVRHLLGTEKSTDPDVLRDIERYGLGCVRTLEQYELFCGVNFRDRRIEKIVPD